MNTSYLIEETLECKIPLLMLILNKGVQLLPKISAFQHMANQISFY